jgi:hypothetical protein
MDLKSHKFFSGISFDNLRDKEVPRNSLGKVKAYESGRCRPKVSTSTEDVRKQAQTYTHKTYNTSTKAKSTMEKSEGFTAHEEESNICSDISNDLQCYILNDYQIIEVPESK